MPQHLCVCCYQCRVFQVVSETKSGQFRCRLCNEKQFCRKIFDRSSKARDVRIAAQERNAQRAAEEEAEDECDAAEEQDRQDTEPESFNWEQFLSPAKCKKEDGRRELSDRKQSAGKEESEGNVESGTWLSSLKTETDEKSTNLSVVAKFDEKRETKQEKSGARSGRSFFVSDSDLEDLEVD